MRAVWVELLCRDMWRAKDEEALQSALCHDPAAAQTPLLDEHFAAEVARLETVLEGTGDPAQEARAAAEGFLARVDSEPEWRGLYRELAAHAGRNEAFRAQFAARQCHLRERMAAVFERWASDLGATPTVPARDVAAMAMFMADGFLLARTIEPHLDAALYGRMFEVLLHGLMSVSDTPASVA